MKNKLFIGMIIWLMNSFYVTAQEAETISPYKLSNDPISYLIGGIIALLIMVYLVYTLIRPEKF